MEPATIASLVIGGLALLATLFLVVVVLIALAVLFRRDPRRVAQRALRKAVQEQEVREQAAREASVASRAVGYEVTE